MYLFRFWGSYFVLTFFAFPRLFLLGSSLRFLLAAFLRPFLPSECAFDLGKHFGLPSLFDPLAQSPLIFPSGPNLTHFSLNHFLRSSFKSSANNKLPQFTQKSTSSYFTQLGTRFPNMVFMPFFS